MSEVQISESEFTECENLQNKNIQTAIAPSKLNRPIGSVVRDKRSGQFLLYNFYDQYLLHL